MYPLLPICLSVNCDFAVLLISIILIIIIIIIIITVTVNDDDPKTGYITLFLDFPQLKVKRSMIGPAKPQNADVTINITDRYT